MKRILGSDDLRIQAKASCAVHFTHIPLCLRDNDDRGIGPDDPTLHQELEPIQVRRMGVSHHGINVLLLQVVQGIQTITGMNDNEASPFQQKDGLLPCTLIVINHQHMFPIAKHRVPLSRSGCRQLPYESAPPLS